MDKKIIPLKYFFLGTLALYGVIFLFVKTDYFYFHGDTHEYAAIANNMLDYHAFSRQLPESEIIRTPIYPSFIALTMAIAGRQNFVYLIILIQTFFVALTAWLIARLGEKVFQNIPYGNIAAIIYILLPTTIWYAMVGMTEITFIFVFIFAIYLLNKSFLSGMLVGLSILIRPIAILSPIILFPIAAENRRRGILFLAGLLVILSPWLIRNYARDFGLNISYIGAFNLAHGNATKFYAWRNHIDNQTALDIIQGEVDAKIKNEDIRSDTAHIRVAKKYIFSNFPAYIYFHAVKTIPFFVGSSLKEATTAFRSSNASQNTSDMIIRGSGVLGKLLREWPFTLESLARAIITILMLIGTWRALKERNKRALMLFALIMLFALLSSPWASPRFRLPFEPFIFLLAFYGFSFIKSRILRARESQV